MSYLISDYFILKYPKDLELYESHAVQDKDGAVAAYVVYQQQQKIALIQVIDKELSWDSVVRVKSLETEAARPTSYPNNWKRKRKMETHHTGNGRSQPSLFGGDGTVGGGCYASPIQFKGIFATPCSSIDETHHHQAQRSF
jgi:hypothetical protein